MHYCVGSEAGLHFHGLLVAQRTKLIICYTQSRTIDVTSTAKETES